MKEKKRRWGRIIVALLVIVGTAYGGWRYFKKGVVAVAESIGSNDKPQEPVVVAPVDARAPAGVRIKVEVINTTTIKGLARRGTLFLRDRGFDVVGTGTVKPPRDSTLVLDRSGHPEWARLVAKALNARMESRPDSGRFLDVTVLLGGNWRPPPFPFYP